MLALVPLDDRPCNVRFPQQIAAIGGDAVVVPPLITLGHFNNPGQPADIARWLHDLPQVEALIVSIDMISYGGLVASRKPHVGEDEALARLEMLKVFRRTRPETPIFAFNILMRLAITMDSDEAVPHYYNVMRYARLADECERFNSDYLRAELEKVREQIPPRVLDEYLRARARNHSVNLKMCDWLAENVFDYLLITQEDATEYGLHRREQDEILERVETLQIGDKFSLHPGADEAALTLLARRWKTNVTFRIHASDAEDMKRIAPFEDRPYNIALQQHVSSMCGQIVEDNADFELFVNAPVGGSQRDENEDARIGRREKLQGFIAQIAEYSNAIPRVETAIGSIEEVEIEEVETEAAKNATQNEASEDRVLDVTDDNAVASENATSENAADANDFEDELASSWPRVALCDVAFPNGADNVLMNELDKRDVLGFLAVFGGWNTAGNTTGTVLAHCAALQRARESGDQSRLEEAQTLSRQFLFERLIDDWCYQSQVRSRIERVAREAGLVPHNMTAELNGDATRAQEIQHNVQNVELQMRRELRGFAQLLAKRHFGAALLKSEITLPWKRAFEADVRMELV